MDRIYRVTFFKRLTDSTGHPSDPCQGAIEVHASNEDRAVRVARERFAKLTDVSAWSLRADYETVEFLPQRKRASILAWRRSRRSQPHQASGLHPSS